MDKKIVTFYETEIEEYEFHQYKSSISINDKDISEMVVSNKFPFGKQDFKYFIGYKYNKKIRPLYIIFPAMSTYKINFDKTKHMFFMIEDKNFFDKYMKIWEKVSNIIKNKFNSELIYDKIYLKTKKQFNTKDGFQCFYIPVILINLVCRKEENYYPKLFIEKFIHNFF